MNNVIENLEYLVRRHDCVVIPKWGAFIAHYQAASYDEERGLMLPPSRSLMFNSEVDRNDGLLTASVSRRRGIPFALASRLVEEEVASMKGQLERDGEVSLGHVGRLIRQAESSPIFEPSMKITRYEASCLNPVKATPLTAIRASRQQEPAAVAPRRRKRLTARVIRVAASLAVLAVVAAALSVPALFSGRNDQLASVASVTPNFSVQSSQTSILPTATSSAALTLNIAMPTEAPVEPAPFVAPAPSVRHDRYCLVIASLPSAEQARSFVARHPSVALDVLAKDGKYRVYAKSAPTYEEAAEAKSLPEIASVYPDAWVCRM